MTFIHPKQLINDPRENEDILINMNTYSKKAILYDESAPSSM